jgi:hypothetical protein
LPASRTCRSTAQAQTIDTTTKDEFPYGSSAPGARSISLPATFIPSLPDANGYDRLVSLANGTDPFKIRIIDTANADEVVFRMFGLCHRPRQQPGRQRRRRRQLHVRQCAAPEVDTL